MLNPKLLKDGTFAKLIRKHKAGAVLFRQGNPGNTMYVMVEGYIRILYEYDQVSHLVGIIGPGEMLGEKAILLDEKHSYMRNFTAEAKTDTVVLEIDKEAFKTLCVQWPDFQVRIMRMIEDRLEKANELVSVLQSLDPLSRFEKYVQYFYKHHCMKLPKGVYVTMTAAEIQLAANLESEFVKANLEKLVRENILSVIDDGYVVRDESALASLSGFRKSKKAA